MFVNDSKPLRKLKKLFVIRCDHKEFFKFLFMIRCEIEQNFKNQFEHLSDHKPIAPDLKPFLSDHKPVLFVELEKRLIRWVETRGNDW